MRGMKPEDVYALKGVSDPRLSPDGTTVAFVPWSIDGEANEYRGNIWLAPVDGSEPPRRFTTGERRDGEPRWSPDGRSLAFVSSRAEKEPGQLYVISLRGGEAQKLTKLKEDVRGVAWSPDGRTIAFTSRVRDEESEEEDERRRPPRRVTHLLYKLDNEGWIADRRSQVFVVAADGSAEPRQLTDAEHEHGAPVWSPDGSQLVFSTTRGDDWDTQLVSDLYVMSADGGEPQLLTHGDGSCSDPAWSPDGTRIAYRYTPDPWVWGRHTQITVLDLATRERSLLTESLDRQCGPYPPQREPIWNNDQIVFSVEDGGSIHVYSVPADGSGEPELLVGGERVVNGFDVRDGALVHAASTPATFADLYVGDTRVTDSTEGFPAQVVEPERFTARSKDGTEVEAWLVRPAGFEEGKRYPVLLSIHGGPYTQYVSSFFDEFQVYSGAGYAVVFANPRGSSGYGEDWGTAIRGGPQNDAGTGVGHRRLRGPDRGAGRGARALRLPRPGAHRRARRLVRRLHDVVDRLAHRPLQGGVLGAGGEQPLHRDGLERHLLGIQGVLRHVRARGDGGLARALAVRVRRQDRDAAFDHALGGRPPLLRRAGGASVHDHAPARQGGRVRALPGRGTRDVTLRRAGSPRAALRGAARLVRQVPAGLTRSGDAGTRFR